MLTEMLLIPTAAGALAFTGLKLHKQRQYHQLQMRQNDLVAQYSAALNGSVPDMDFIPKPQIHIG